MKNYLGLALAALLAASACSGGGPGHFRIVAGSEEKAMESLVKSFCRKHGVTCDIEYKGSLDIGLALAEATPPDVDAVWPASSLWVELYDKDHRVKNLKSIATTPVVLGVRMSKAKELVWIGKRVTMNDILTAVDSKKLTFLMTSATQSNSGAAAYLAMLASAFGDGSRLDPRALDDEAARTKVQTLLKGVARSSGSSGWLMDLYLDSAKTGKPYDAMWNYEAVLKEANDELRQSGGELLYAVYPADGVTYADAPLGYLDRGQPKGTRDFFDGLQAYLLSPPTQQDIANTGRHTALGMATPAKAETDWNFDPSRVVPSIGLPEPAVIARALSLYQEALRRPSLTAICLDFSGSMEGDGERQVKAAVHALFNPDVAARSLTQWTPSDHIFILPFDSDVREVVEGDGTPASQAHLLAMVDDQHAGGGTDIYACAERALTLMKPYIDQGTYLPAIVLMTDGRSEENNGFVPAWQQAGENIPVFGVTFGDAEKSQLDTLAKTTRARVFDGGKNLTDAFRTVRGYN